MDRETRKYWAEQRRQMLRRDRQQRGYTSTDLIVTKIILALMVLSYLVDRFLPAAIATMASAPGGMVWMLLWSALFPGSLLGLIFAGVFIWIIGSQLEGLTEWWQYLVIFVVSGVFGSVAARLLSGGLASGMFAAFGLAGAYVMAMTNRRVGGMAQWALFLLAINVILSGFNPPTLAGMLVAFFVGLSVARWLNV